MDDQAINQPYTYFVSGDIIHATSYSAKRCEFTCFIKVITFVFSKGNVVTLKGCCTSGSIILVVGTA